MAHSLDFLLDRASDESVLILKRIPRCANACLKVLLRIAQAYCDSFRPLGRSGRLDEFNQHPPEMTRTDVASGTEKCLCCVVACKNALMHRHTSIVRCHLDGSLTLLHQPLVKILADPNALMGFGDQPPRVSHHMGIAVKD